MALQSIQFSHGESCPFFLLFSSKGSSEAKARTVSKKDLRTLESRLTQSFHFKDNLPMKQAIIVPGLYYLHQATHWESVLGEGRHAVVWETWSLRGRSPLRRLDNDIWTGWMMSTGLLWVSYKRLESHKQNEFVLAMTHHALFYTATKEALYSFGYDDKKGYFVRKITNKLILIPSEKRK